MCDMRTKYSIIVDDIDEIDLFDTTCKSLKLNGEIKHSGQKNGITSNTYAVDLSKYEVIIIRLTCKIVSFSVMCDQIYA